MRTLTMSLTTSNLAAAASRAKGARLRAKILRYAAGATVIFSVTELSDLLTLVS